MPHKKIADTGVKKKGTPDDIDKHVGVRLRLRRSMLGFSQEKLAEAVGVTFQQVQKYERGANRISASRLLTFSKFLQVPINYFFEDMDADKLLPNVGFAEDDQEAYDDGALNEGSLLKQKETMTLLRAYYSISDEKVRKEILKIIKSMAKNIS